MFGDIFKRLQHFDAYPKPLEDFRVKTLSGAIITVLSTLAIIFLAVYEWQSYFRVDVDQELFVDLTRNQKLTINLNLTFVHIPCDLLSVDAMDVSGEHQIDVVKGLKKVRLDAKGEAIVDKTQTKEQTTSASTTVSHNANETGLVERACGSCYGAEASNIKCCNTCDDVRAAYKQKNWQFSPYGISQCVSEYGERNNQATVNTKDKEAIKQLLKSGEGCRLEGHLEVNKVAGNFHIAPGISFQQNHMHFHDVKQMPLDEFDTKHYFDTFSFGDSYPNQFNPLEQKSLQMEPPTSSKMSEANRNLQNIINFDFINLNSPENPESKAVSYSYFLKIVPTTYEYLDGRVINNTYQYSVTKSAKLISGANTQSLPGVFISYELGPIMIKFIEKSKSFSHFLTSICAIIGGLFTIAGMLDGFTFRYYNMYKKYQINKLT